MLVIFNTCSFNEIIKNAAASFIYCTCTYSVILGNREFGLLRF